MSFELDEFRILYSQHSKKSRLSSIQGTEAALSNLVQYTCYEWPSTLASLELEQEFSPADQ